jgi:lycopene beta-cyclase
MVHPSTGYHACRMMAASTDLAEAVGQGIRENHPPDRISAAAYASTWSPKTRGQRDFQAYGGDFLMRQVSVCDYVVSDYIVSDYIVT